MTRFVGLLLALAALLLPISAAAAQTGSPSPELQMRIDGAIAILNGEGEIEDYFTHAFLSQVPAGQVRTISEQLRAQYGPIEGVGAIEPHGPWSAQLLVNYASATATVRLILDPEPPHRVNGFLIADVTPRNDSAESLAADIAALPGEAGFLIARLGEDGVEPIAGHDTEQPLAVGSSFKLYVLAEAARQIGEGEHRWDEVIPLGPASLPSGMTQSWPRGAPMTVYSLAALMISISDNTATDTLLRTLGREAIEAMMERAGNRHLDRALPLLTTAESFSLRGAANADLLAAWNTAAGPEERRAVLDRGAERLGVSALRASDYSGRPNAIGSVEWFASPADMARALDWLRRHGDEATHDILAIAPGITQSMTARWRYIGFKGGSETGVIALNFLVESEAGDWYAVTGAWNDFSAAVDEARFMALMTRALHLTATH